MRFVAIRKACTYSTAVDASRPRVELKDGINTTNEMKVRDVLVPAGQQAPRCQCFTNRYSFLLPAGDPSQCGIPNWRFSDVSQAKQCHQDIRDFVPKLLACYSLSPCPRNAHLRGETDCLFDGQRWEMYIVLWAVLDISTIVKAYVVWSKRVIVNLPFDGMEFVTTIGQYFEECGTPGSRSAENN